MSRTCSVEGCNGKHRCKGYCSKHYQQYLKYGEIRKEFELNGVNKNGIVFIYIGDKVTYVDMEDYNRIKSFRWYIDKDGYVVGYVNGKMVKLHRFITDCPQDKVVDHINRNKLDNRKSNLRICSVKDNNKNHSKSCNNKSGYKNIYKVKNRELWKVAIRADGNEYVKYFKLDELNQAIEWRNEVLKRVHGEYANLDN
jgi:hypothetical protein